MTPDKYVFQCAKCGTVFGPQSATDALKTAILQHDSTNALIARLRDSLTETLAIATRNEDGDFAKRAFALLRETT